MNTHFSSLIPHFSSPFRVLHVFGKLTESGGAEKWMLALFRLRDPRVRFDFLLNVDDGPLVGEARDAGSDVHLVPFSRSPIPYPWGNPYLAGVRRVLRNEKYDVVHVHQFDLAGEILRIADREGVPVRVMSLHATRYPNGRSHRRIVYEIFGKPWILRHATSILACSRLVRHAFFKYYSLNPRFQVHYTGIDPAQFLATPEQRKEERVGLCRELGIPEDATIVGHVGRFTQQKNHAYLTDVLEILLHKNPGTRAVLVGEGELHGAIRDRVRAAGFVGGLKDRVLLTGARDDVPRLMRSLFDVFVLPSLYEGFPIVALEAVAAGLDVVQSDRITDELLSCFPDRVVSLPLEPYPAWTWVEALQNAIARKKERDAHPEHPPVDLEQTPFTLHRSLDRLIRLYENDFNGYTRDRNPAEKETEPEA